MFVEMWDFNELVKSTTKPALKKKGINSSILLFRMEEINIMSSSNSRLKIRSLMLCLYS